MKNKILNFLEKGEKSQSEISVSLGINYYKVVNCLIELEKEKKVERIIKSMGTYWCLE